MKTRETRLQLEPTLDDWLTSQAAIAGIAKTKYIIQALEDLKTNASHTHSIKLSNMDNDQSDELADIRARLAKLEGACHSAPTGAVELKGTKAKIALSNGEQIAIKNDDRCLYHDGHLWLITKSANGSQQKLTQLTAMDDRLFSYLTTDYRDRYSIERLGQAAIRFDELVGLGLYTLSPSWVANFISGCLSHDEAAYPEYRTGVLEFIEKHKPRIEEPVAALISVADRNPSEALEVASSPIDEPIQLTAKQLAARLTTGNDKRNKGIEGTLQTLGGETMKTKAILSWTSQHDPSGLSWLPTDVTRETWVSQPATV